MEDVQNEDEKVGPHESENLSSLTQILIYFSDINTMQSNVNVTFAQQSIIKNFKLVYQKTDKNIENFKYIRNYLFYIVLSFMRTYQV